MNEGCYKLIKEDPTADIGEALTKTKEEYNTNNQSSLGAVRHLLSGAPHLFTQRPFCLYRTPLMQKNVNHQPPRKRWFKDALPFWLTLLIIIVLLVVQVYPALYTVWLNFLPFRGYRVLMTAILVITGVPLLTNLLALYQMGVILRKAHLPFWNDRIFIVIVYIGFYLPLSVWIAKGFFDAIPRDLEEAALIDGCTPIVGFFLFTRRTFFKAMVEGALKG